MKLLHTYILGLFLSSLLPLHSQTRNLQGRVIDESNEPLPAAHISVASTPPQITYTDSTGRFLLQLPIGMQQDSLYIQVSYIGYFSLRDTLYLPSVPLSLMRRYKLRPRIEQLSEVVITPDDRAWELPVAGQVEVNTKQLSDLPSLSSDVSNILGLLPGVVANRGLSNAYSVRGGNYQENLFYIEGMPIYTPYLARSGQQEGLSLANISLTRSLSFSAGGWAAKYGDKLSSMLNVHYKDPKKSRVGILLGLLGAEAHLETAHKRRPFRLLLGARYKDTRYFLRNLDTKGEYSPRFSDIQGLLRVGLSSVPNKSELLLFGAYANNRYRLTPSTRESTFGTISRQLHFLVAFQGKELLAHDIIHTGIKWTHYINDEVNIRLLNTSSLSYEREYFDIGSAFRLCDIVENGQNSADDCQIEVGQATHFDYGRNFLRAVSNYSQASTEAYLNDQHQISVGTFLQYERIDDHLQEYRISSNEGISHLEFSRDMDTILYRTIIGGYLQHTFYNHLRTRWLTTGLRLNYVSLSQQWLLSPRLQFSFIPQKKSSVVYKMAVGLYPQPPFYREMRDVNGDLNTNLRAQQSLHLLAGVEYSFSFLGTDFRLFTDTYYKQLLQLIPYEQENIRIRYSSHNRSQGYAYGLDGRLYGFFVPGQESWVSVSYLHTKEDIKEDNYGYIRRPTDQRITISLFFRDYLPQLPSWQVYTKMLFGTGMPFNPVGMPYYRNSFEGEDYYQLDIGFSKIFSLRSQKERNQLLTITLEVLNLLGSSQNISYNWIGLEGTAKFAVPNDFSAQFINLKLRLSL